MKKAAFMLLLLVISIPAFAQEFPDVPADHWAYQAVQELVNAGIIQGYPDGTYGGPALAAGADRVFPLFGQCDIPSTARAVSVNLTVTQPSARGNVRLYPARTPLPVVSSLNYTVGQTRAGNGVASLNGLGELAVRCSQASGTAHFILDVNGYFE